MKKIYTPLFPLILIMTFSQSVAAQNRAGDDGQFGFDPCWYSKAKEKIEAIQYSIRKIQNGFVTANPGNHTMYEFDETGFLQKATAGETAPVEIRLQTFGRKQIARNQCRSRAVNGAEINFNFDDLTIQYLNSSEGMRQNFIIHRATEEKDQLELTLQLNTNLAIGLNEDKKGISFYDQQGRRHYSYDGLSVWDAHGKALKGEMRLEGKLLHILVNVREARYPVTVDPLNHTPSWTDNGNGLVFPLLNDLSAHLLYGYSVNSAGDVNGDGYGDIIVGAPAFVDIVSVSGGTFNAAAVGAAFLYYGSSSGPATDPSEVLQPTTQAGALFGYSVSKAGDVNGDGYGDIVVGAPGDHTSLNIGLVFPATTSVAVGKVYVYYGGAAGSFDGDRNTEATVSAQLTLSQSDFGPLAAIPVNPLYGFSVAEAGDVNGDGRGDILVGSPGYTRLLPLPLRSGRVDVYLGTALGLSSTPSRTITGGLLNALFGFSVSTAGSVNGDSYSDIIVGAPGSLDLLGAGQAFVFHGSSTGITATTTAGASSILNSGGLLTTLFGFSVSNAGDVNRDGFADVLIGEPAALESLLTQTVSVGAAHIFYGSSSGAAAAGQTILRSPRRPSILGLVQGNLLFGFSVSATGDMNCDGFDDIIVGEPGGTALSLGSGLLNIVSTNAVSGRSYVYYGSPAKPTSLPSYTFEQTGSVSVANLIGYSVSDAGDVNGDGRAELLIGAPNGTLNLAGGILPAVNSALGIITTNSVGSSYLYAGCLPSPSPLPVDLVSFTGRKLDGKVALSWRVESQVNLDLYEIERSQDGRSYAGIGIVFPTESQTAADYQFRDASPGAENFYRLKMIDKDGTIKYSGVIRVQFGGRAVVALQVTPNPARGQFSVHLQGLAGGKYELVLLNTSGAAVLRKSIAVAGDSQIQMMDKGKLPPGLYIINLSNARGSVASTRVVIQ